MPRRRSRKHRNEARVAHQIQALIKHPGLPVYNQLRTLTVGKSETTLLVLAPREETS